MPHDILAPLHGLVLAGGRSTRMGRDKAVLEYRDGPQLKTVFGLLQSHVWQCHVAVQAAQRHEPVRAGLPMIEDVPDVEGPAAGVLAAHARHPQAAWLVVACDMPMLDHATLAALVEARDGRHAAIAYQGTDGLPEPLCTLWEHEALSRLRERAAAGRCSLRDVLRHAGTLLLPAPGASLDNVNTPEERERLLRRLQQGVCDD